MKKNINVSSIKLKTELMLLIILWYLNISAQNSEHWSNLIKPSISHKGEALKESQKIMGDIEISFNPFQPGNGKIESTDGKMMELESGTTFLQVEFDFIPIKDFDIGTNDIVLITQTGKKYNSFFEGLSLLGNDWGNNFKVVVKKHEFETLKCLFIINEDSLSNAEISFLGKVEKLILNK